MPIDDLWGVSKSKKTFQLDLSKFKVKRKNNIMYSLIIPLGTSEDFEMLRSLENDLRNEGVTFDRSNILDEEGFISSRLWHFDWSLTGRYTPQKLMKVLENSGFTFTVQIKPRTDLFRIEEGKK